jgi:hypothetical protein
MVNLDAEANFKGNIFLTKITLTWEEVTAPLLTLKKKIIIIYLFVYVRSER